jgi:ribose transport system substrate-binding protein
MIGSTSQHSSHRHLTAMHGALVLVLSAAIALGAAACGSSASSGGGSADAGSGLSPLASSEVQAAKAFTARYSATPTTIGPTTPLRAKPPTGKTVVWAQCALPACQYEGQGLEAAAKALGWNLRIIGYDASNPVTLVSAMQQALQYKPVAVVTSGVAVSSWSTVLPAYRAAGVPILLDSVGTVSITPPIAGVVGVKQDYATPGRVIANWFIADSDAQGHALWVTAPQYQVLNWNAQAGIAAIKQGCKACKVTELGLTLTEIGNNGVGPAIVSALQKDPSIKYVLVSDGFISAGLSSALRSAGLSDVKIGVCGASITDEQNLLNGTENAVTATGYTDLGWQMMDMVVRKVENMPIPVGDGGYASQLLTKANVGTPNGDLKAPADYAQLYEKLWKLS